MRVLIHKNSEKAARWTADYIAKKVLQKNSEGDKFVLGLPTGSTPLEVYKELITKHKSGDISFRNVISINMDEYVGLPEEHPQSYHNFMYRNFFDHIDIEEERIQILNGNADDLQKECENYEEAIAEAGGIDLFFGGIGEDGHIAFNEPASSLGSKTRVKTLADSTIEANARFFENDKSKVPRKALTVGVNTVLSASEVLIMAVGMKKARALRHIIEGHVSHMWTASALQYHPNAIVVCDEEAAKELMYGTVRYFQSVEKHELDHLL